VSATTPVVPVAPRPMPRAARRPDTEVRRPLVRLGAFGVLALYGTVRWGTLLDPAPTGRLFGLFAITLVLAAGGAYLVQRSRALAIALCVVAAVAMIAVCGLPVHWIRHLRIAVSANAIGTGLSALPQLLVPYKGAEPWVRMVILLGAAVLLFDAALMVAFGMTSPWRARAVPSSGQADARRGETGDLRRAVAALPLIALAAVPLTLVPAKLPYLQGLIVFALLAALVWGERLPERGAATSVALCAVAAIVAMVLAPAIDTHAPWINYRTLAGDLGGNAAEAFDWNQGYGPLNWPQNDRQVFEVKAPRADYWKAENLDIFNGHGWAPEPAALSSPPPGVSQAALNQWTHPVTVTIDAMSTTDIIGPGDVNVTHASERVNPGTTEGRWVAPTPLGPGDTYTVLSYSPHPSPTQLAAAGTDYTPSLLDQDLSLTLPPSAASGGGATVFIPPFGSPSDASVQSDSGENGAFLLAASPYQRAYALAQSLRSTASTPYAFIENVKTYLQHGYTYNQNPPTSTDPLLTFLFQTKTGYCQQFAGAMALLLRLGGVPARVAAGFTSGQYNRSAHRYVVTDFDAHAWVEAFFPGYGWVEFDPTPTVAPARAQTGVAPVLPSSPAPKPKASTHGSGSHGLTTPGSTTGAAARRHASGSSGFLVVGLAALASVLAAALAILRPWRRPSLPSLLTELERAFTRTGRPLTPDVTLSEIERRLGGSPSAAAYVRSLRDARFSEEAATLPSAAQRRALRGALSSGLGLMGTLRALWALPPRPLARSRRRTSGSGQAAGLH
jgi:protein-glutamine gamma-glutamyltransferase